MSCLTTENESSNLATLPKESMAEFMNLGLPRATDKATWMEFDKLTDLISQPNTIHCTAGAVNALIRPPSKQPTQRARIFLTAYVILTCPDAILQETPMALRKRLHVAAKRLLVSVETACCTGQYSAAGGEIQTQWQTYGRIFQTWKKNDRAQLLAASTAHYHGLMDLKYTIQCNTPEGPDRQEACTALEEQLRQVQAKIEQLGGPVVHVASRAEPSIPTPPPSNSKADQHEDNERQRQQAIDVLESMSQRGASNEQLAHEIILNPEFKLQRPQGVGHHVENTMRRAFFDKLDDDLTHGVAGAHAALAETLADLRERLLQVSPKREHETIRSSMDLELLQQQLEAGVCDLDAKIEWIVSVMQRACAPVRDDAVAAIHGLPRTSDKLCSIVNVLQDMAVDLANAQLRALRPHLMSIAIDYGRAKFEAAAAADLPRTEQWLHDALERLAASNKPTPQAVFQDALVNLLLSPVSAADGAPETLRLDVARLVQFQNTAQAITVVAALLTLARNFGVTDEDEHAALAETLFTLLKNDTSLQHLIAEIERRVTKDATRRQPPPPRELIGSMVDKTLSHQDAIYALLSRRVGSVLRAYLATRDMAAPTALHSYGLRHVAGPLQALCEHVHALADYNYRVHEARYARILGRMAQPHG